MCGTGPSKIHDSRYATLIYDGNMSLTRRTVANGLKRPSLTYEGVHLLRRNKALPISFQSQILRTPEAVGSERVTVNGCRLSLSLHSSYLSANACSCFYFHPLSAINNKTHSTHTIVLPRRTRTTPGTIFHRPFNASSTISRTEQREYMFNRASRSGCLSARVS